MQANEDHNKASALQQIKIINNRSRDAVYDSVLLYKFSLKLLYAAIWEQSYDRLCYELTPFSNLLLQTTTCNSVKALKWTEFVTITVVSVRVSVMSHIKKK